MTPQLEFNGDVVIVTGAGSGLGRAHALELARRGARIVVNDLGADPSGTGASSATALATVEAIRKEGGEAVANPDSVATPEGGRAIVQTALDTWGRVDAVVHNAGFSQDNHFEDMTVAEVRAVVDVHLLGCFFVAQPAYAAMKDNGGGRMVFTTSTAGLLGAPLMSNYAAAKMGVVGFTRSLALEGQQYGIKANALSPGALTRRGDDRDAFRFGPAPNRSTSPRHQDSTGSLPNGWRRWWLSSVIRPAPSPARCSWPGRVGSPALGSPPAPAG